MLSYFLVYSIDVNVFLPDTIVPGQKLKCVYVGSEDEDFFCRELLADIEKRQLADKIGRAIVVPKVSRRDFDRSSGDNIYDSFLNKELKNIILNMFDCISGKAEHNLVITEKELWELK